MNREQIKALALRIRPVKTDAWGTVHVRELRADELEAVLGIIDTATGSERLARLCVLGAVQPTGAQLFLQKDVEWLARSSLESVSALATAILDLNGLSEGLEKKSPSLPSSDLPSTLPNVGAIPRPKTSSLL